MPNVSTAPRKMLDQPQLWTDFKGSVGRTAEKNQAGSRKTAVGGITSVTVSQSEMTGTGMRASGTGSTAPA